MSSFDRRTLLLALSGLAACGFEPVYGPGGTGRALRGEVAIDAPSTEADYLLVRNLEQKLGRPAGDTYRLTVGTRITQQGQAVTDAGEITRYSLVGEGDYVLRRRSDDAVLGSGKVHGFTGYSATGSTVETLSAESDARERLMQILADQITTRLYATLKLPE